MNDKKLYMFTSILLLCFFLTACQQTNQEGNHSQLDLPEPITYSQHQDDEYVDDQPQLKGGSERDMREPHPVSNNKLQQDYPNIVVLHGSPDKNQVALTFDDGPDKRFTPQVLDTLAKHDVKATFFLIGARVREHRDITNRIHHEGHAIGNHTYWHPNLPKEDLERLHWELTETEKAIADIIGFKPRLFRSPYGALNEEMVEILGDNNQSIVGWNVDSLDWKQPGADIVADNVLSNVGFGSIILMHDGGDWSMDLSGTVQALDRIISKLKDDGTEFVTVPELIGIPEAK